MSDIEIDSFETGNNELQGRVTWHVRVWPGASCVTLTMEFGKRAWQTGRLRASEARRIAAALLRAADEADTLARDTGDAR